MKGRGVVTSREGGSDDEGRGVVIKMGEGEVVTMNRDAVVKVKGSGCGERTSKVIGVVTLKGRGGGVVT